ncbi:unnamed protein product [Phytomonas sp. Hart1]|nr:unnamed protein product [Phytomonas sp. Hart1]|eukprot:CCW66509.1 unnamed protein product [Phytomonas sp. isolate Hart1]
MLLCGVRPGTPFARLYCSLLGQLAARAPPSDEAGAKRPSAPSLADAPRTPSTGGALPRSRAKASGDAGSPFSPSPGTGLSQTPLRLLRSHRGHGEPDLDTARSDPHAMRAEPKKPTSALPETHLDTRYTPLPPIFESSSLPPVSAVNPPPGFAISDISLASFPGASGSSLKKVEVSQAFLPMGNGSLRGLEDLTSLCTSVWSSHERGGVGVSSRNESNTGSSYMPPLEDLCSCPQNAPCTSEPTTMAEVASEAFKTSLNNEKGSITDKLSVIKRTNYSNFDRPPSLNTLRGRDFRTDRQDHKLDPVVVLSLGPIFPNIGKHVA